MHPVRPDFSLHLRVRRISEELAAAQKIIQEYENLFATVHHIACEHCKQIFKKFAGLSDQNNEIDSVPSISVASSNASTSQGSPCVQAQAVPVWPGREIPQIARSSNRQHGQTACTAAAETESAQGSVAISTRRSRHPPELRATTKDSLTIQTRWQARYTSTENVKPMLKVELVHVWKHGSPVACVKFSPLEGHLAVELAEGNQETLIYDVTVGERTSVFADRYRLPNENPAPLWTNSLSFSPGGRYLATGYSHGQTLIWQVKNKRVRNAFRVDTENPIMVYVDFSPNGRLMATGPQNFGGVHIWSMRDGSLSILQDGTSFRALVLAVKFSPDGRYVTASDSKGTIRTWNVRTSKLVRKWKAHDIAIRCITFTPDGRGLVTGCNDRTIKYWDFQQPPDSREHLKFIGHADIVRSVAVSPDGRWLASGSDDHTVRIWDMKDASLLCTLFGHKQKAWSVAFSPTSKYVACGNVDCKVSVWKLSEPSG